MLDGFRFFLTESQIGDSTTPIELSFSVCKDYTIYKFVLRIPLLGCYTFPEGNMYQQKI